MKNITSFVTLDTAIDGVMADLRETTTNNYSYYLNWGLDIWREINLFKAVVIKTIYVTMGDNFTIPYPSDYIKYMAVGTPINGRLWTLSLNQNLLPKKLDECDVPIEEVIANPNIASTYPYAYYFSGSFRNGQYVGEQFALGGGWNKKGYFKEDDDNKQFIFQGVVPKGEIVIQYQSTGVACDGTVEIPYETISTIKAGIHWLMIENDKLMQRQNPSAQIALSNRKERLFKSEWSKLSHYRMAFTIAEYYDMRLGAARATPHR